AGGEAGVGLAGVAGDRDARLADAGRRRPDRPGPGVALRRGRAQVTGGLPLFGLAAREGPGRRAAPSGGDGWVTADSPRLSRTAELLSREPRHAFTEAAGSCGLCPAADGCRRLLGRLRLRTRRNGSAGGPRALLLRAAQEGPVHQRGRPALGPVGAGRERAQSPGRPLQTRRRKRWLGPRRPGTAGRAARQTGGAQARDQDVPLQRLLQERRRPVSRLLRGAHLAAGPAGRLATSSLRDGEVTGRTARAGSHSPSTSFMVYHPGSRSARKRAAWMAPRA